MSTDLVEQETDEDRTGTSIVVQGGGVFVALFICCALVAIVWLICRTVLALHGIEAPRGMR